MDDLVKSERPEQNTQSIVLVIIAFAAVYVIWGSTYLAIKYAVASLPPLLMAGFRFVCAGSALFVWARLRGAPRPELVHWSWTAAVGALLFLGGNGGLVWAEQTLPSGFAALLVATEPLWVVVLYWMRPQGVRPSGKTILGLFLGLIGVWLLVKTANSIDASDRRAMVAALVVVLAALSWAAGSLLSLRAKLPSGALLSASMQMICGGAFLLLAGTLSGEWMHLSFHNFSTRSLVALLYLIVCGSLVGFTSYSWLVQVVKPASVATYAYVNPLVACFLGWAIASEVMTLRSLLAGTAIIGSVILIMWKRQSTSWGWKLNMSRAEDLSTRS